MITIRYFLYNIPKPLEFSIPQDFSSFSLPANLTNLMIPPKLYVWVPSEDLVEALHIFDLSTRQPYYKIMVQTCSHKIVLSHTTTTPPVDQLLEKLISTHKAFKFMVLKTERDILVLNEGHLRGVFIVDSQNLPEPTSESQIARRTNEK
jgi:hypothetical protein